MYNFTVKALVLDRLALVLAFGGMFVSGVLSLGEHFGASVPCGESHGCDTVARHASSHALGIPNAYLGFLVYALLAFLIASRLFRKDDSRAFIVAGYAISGLGTLASLALTVISVVVIRATCVWCLTSAGIMIALFIVHGLRWQGGEQPRATRPMAFTADVVLLVILILGAAFALGVEGAHLAQIASTAPLDPAKVKNATVADLIPKDAHIYGDPTAPVTIVEFGDLVCPACKTEYPLIKDYVGRHNGQVRYVFRHHPMTGMSGHEFALPAAAIAEVAADQGKFWQFLNAVYGADLKEPVQLDAILDVAKQVGIDPAKALERIRDPNDPAFERTYRDIQDSNKVGVIGTPAFFLVAPDGTIIQSTMYKLFDDLKRPEFEKYIQGG